jgi:hypothetical protein
VCIYASQENEIEINNKQNENDGEEREPPTKKIN